MAYLRKDGNIWYVSWRDGGRGSKVRSLRVGPKHSEALKVKVTIESRRLTGRFGIVVPLQIGFDAFSEKWMDSRTVKRQTQRRDRGIIRTHLAPAFGSSPVFAITPEQVAACVAVVAKKTSQGTGRRVYAVLRKMLQDAKVWQYAAHNPAVDVRAPSLQRRFEIRFPSLDELGAALEAVPPSKRPIVFTLLLTGMRWGELAGLEWNDVHLETGKLSVRRSIAAGNREATTTKTGTHRIIDLLPPVRRRVPEVKDIEVVAIPRRRALFDMPDAAAQENLLHEWALASGIRWIKPGTSEIVDWPLKRDGKYWRGLLPEGIKLDLFLCTPENWGIVFLIRTGSAAFTKELVTPGQQTGKRALGGFLRNGMTEESPIIPTPEERDVFHELGLVWVTPPMRIDGHALHSLSVAGRP